jgi:protein tyrosine phosphatase
VRLFYQKSIYLSISRGGLQVLMATSLGALAAALRDSLRRGRLQREQDTLDQEYVSHEELLASGQCSCGAANESLNRYCNLFPLDAHRVVLRGSTSSDFVNASHVVLPSLPPDEAARGPFIVAQAATLQPT